MELTRLFLIDQSLNGTGTHHFDLMDCLVQGADELGVEAIAAVHQRFPETSGIALPCEIHRVFSQTVYHRVSDLAGLQQLKRVGLNDSRSLVRWANVIGRGWNRWRQRRKRIVREQRITRFGRELQRWLIKFELQEDDHVFLLTVSEIELLAVLQLLTQSPSTVPANWHFLFHFNAFSGRPCDHARQVRRHLDLQQQIRQLRDRLPYHRLRFHATTELLAEQYERLGVPNVHTFSYPVNREFVKEQVDEVARPHDTPLRLAVAGGVRREKGQQQYLPELTRIANRLAAEGAPIQLVVQRPQRSAWRKQKLSAPESESQTQEQGPSIQFVRHPLPKQEYVSLIRSADSGILLYDSESYASRRAGILGEFLACGKPVLVTSGNWLSDQLDEPLTRHAQAIKRQFSQPGEIPSEALTYDSRNVPMPGGVIGFDHDRHPFAVHFPIPAGVGGLVVEYEWHFPKFFGNYSRWELTLDGQPSGLSRVVGQPRHLPSQALFFPVPVEQHLQQGTLRVTNPTSNQTNNLRGLRLTWLSALAATQPIGSVGVVVAEKSQVENAVEELVHHFEHYRDTARHFGRRYRAQHDAAQALRELFPPAAQSMRVA